MEVTATLIKELRDRTGIGMGKCKEALMEAKGDIELAIANLRKSGMASAVKKEGRETKEGRIGFAQDASGVALAEANAETDFVVNNERFVQFLLSVVDEVLSSQPKDLQKFLQQPFSEDPDLTIDQYRATVVQTIGENVQVKRIAYLPRKANTSYGLYSHMNGKIVTLVEIEGSDREEDLAREIAMHCAAAAPEFLSPETVPGSVMAHEKEIALSQAQNKPEQIREKIAEGKVQAFLNGSCLLLQKYIKDDSLSIQELVQRRAKELQKPLNVTHFLRWSVGQS